MSATIQLQAYQPTMRKYFDQFLLPDDQLIFTAYPLYKIDHSTQDTIHVAIVHEEIPVGYFALENGPKLKRYTDNTLDRVMTAFSINYPDQGKGYARAALQQLPAFAKAIDPTLTEVILGVNKKNNKASQLYKATGFIDHHEEFVGSKGPQHILHLPL